MSGKPLVLQDPSAMPGHHLKCVPPPASPRIPQPLLLISAPRALISLYFNCLFCRPSSSHELLWALRSASAGLWHREHLHLLLPERGYVSTPRHRGCLPQGSSLAIAGYHQQTVQSLDHVKGSPTTPPTSYFGV